MATAPGAMQAIASSDPNESSGRPVTPWPMLQPWATLPPTPMSSAAGRGAGGAGAVGHAAAGASPATRRRHHAGASQSWKGSAPPASIAVRVPSAAPTKPSP